MKKTALLKKLTKLEKRYESNPKAILTRQKIEKQATKVMAQLEELK